MGYNTGPIYAKVLVEHASIPLLGLANMIHPHAGTIGKAFVRLVNATSAASTLRVMLGFRMGRSTSREGV